MAEHQEVSQSITKQILKARVSFLFYYNLKLGEINPTYQIFQY